VAGNTKSNRTFPKPSNRRAVALTSIRAFLVRSASSRIGPLLVFSTVIDGMDQLAGGAKKREQVDAVSWGFDGKGGVYLASSAITNHSVSGGASATGPRLLAFPMAPSGRTGVRRKVANAEPWQFTQTGFSGRAFPPKGATGAALSKNGASSTLGPDDADNLVVEGHLIPTSLRSPFVYGKPAPSCSVKCGVPYVLPLPTLPLGNSLTSPQCDGSRVARRRER